MNTLMRWDPIHEFQTISDHLNRLLDPRLAEQRLSNTWMPAVDIEETKEKVYVRAEIPGMKSEDIDVQYENGVLTIRGERRFENETNDRNFHRIERSYGSFARSFTLPATIDSEKVSAKYENGVLELEMPKREEAKPRRIQIGGDKNKVRAA